MNKGTGIAIKPRDLMGSYDLAAASIAASGDLKTNLKVLADNDFDGYVTDCEANQFVSDIEAQARRMQPNLEKPNSIADQKEIDLYFVVSDEKKKNQVDAMEEEFRDDISRAVSPLSDMVLNDSVEDILGLDCKCELKQSRLGILYRLTSIAPYLYQETGNNECNGSKYKNNVNELLNEYVAIEHEMIDYNKETWFLDYTITHDEKNYFAELEKTAKAVTPALNYWSAYRNIMYKYQIPGN